MKIYVGVNSDGTEMVSKQKIKRYIDSKTNDKDVMAFIDTQKPPHWMLDYDGIKIGKYDVPTDRYLTLPQGSIKKMFGLELTWDDNYAEIEL